MIRAGVLHAKENSEHDGCSPLALLLQLMRPLCPIVANGRRARPILVPVLPDQGNLSRVALGKVLEVLHHGVGRMREVIPRILKMQLDSSPRQLQA